jgi:hypothetical protein
MKAIPSAKPVLMLCLSVFISTHAAVIPVPSEKHKTIRHAMLSAKKGDTVLVDAGTYKESIQVSTGVFLVSKVKNGAIISGRSAEKVVSLTSGSSISGFDISGGVFGVYSAAPGNNISYCTIHGNSQSGIMCVGHLPGIEDNIIAFNGSSGIQGWDVRSTISSINHNTICFNGNHGIAVGGNSVLFVENNIISFNEKTGIKGEPGVKITMKKNCFYGNSDIVESFPADNFSYDPLFKAARKMNFTLAENSQCRNMGTDNLDIGARLSGR